MFERLHHQRIAQVLQALDGPLLQTNLCFFGGGTAIALAHGEYRESVDIDFLVSDLGCYRNLRQLLTTAQGIAAIVREGAEPLQQSREVRADQYGIRTTVQIAGQHIKLEIMLEARITLAMPSPHDAVCGIATLAPLDLAASKLLANSDRWADDGVFSRDLIDLAMMKPSRPLLLQAVAKAEQAYGKSILADLAKALHRLKTRDGWLERCMYAMAVNTPRALLWQRLQGLERVLP